MYDPLVSLPYHVDAVQFDGNMSGITIQYSIPDEVSSRGSEYRQRFIPMGVSEEVDQIVAELLDSLCQALDLHTVALRAPAERVSSRPSPMWR